MYSVTRSRGSCYNKTRFRIPSALARFSTLSLWATQGIVRNSISPSLTPLRRWVSLVLSSLSIGKLAQRASVGVKPTGFYERQRLLTAPMRKDSGYRLHPEPVLGRIRFIRRVKELGFSLKEIKESTPFPILALAPNHDVQANGRFPESGTLQTLWTGQCQELCSSHVFTVRGEPMISRKVGIIIACCREIPTPYHTTELSHYHGLRTMVRS
jgi:hypothetical protein